MNFVYAVFATYGATIMLTETEGLGGIFSRLRNIKELKMLTCFTCCAFWVSAIVAIFIAGSILNYLLLVFALTGAATFMDRLQF